MRGSWSDGVVYLNVCSELCFKRITKDEQNNNFKFKLLRRESRIASWGPS